MSYQVLARKWRPQTFEEVVGQESVTRTLQRALSTDRIAHAYLFTGSRGIGKTTIARILAKALSCEQGVTPTPCGTCSACTEITAGKNVDVIEIDGASNTGVDDVRELREVARFMPQSLRFKVFIIDEVHMLSTGAFNALLKTLEEPPPHVKFIFATTEVHKIPVTILSRCQRYDFKRISTDVIVARLKEILGQEGAEIEEAGLTLIARAAEGGMRDSLSLTDQVLSFAGNQASADDVAASLGLIDRRALVRLTQAALERDAQGALDGIHHAFGAGHDLKQLADGLAAELRNLAIARATGTLKGFADLSPEDIAEVDALATHTDGRDLQRLFAMALEGIDRITRSESPRLALEMMLLRMCDRPPLGDAMAISEAISRLDALSRGKAVPPATYAQSQAAAIVRESLEVRPRVSPAEPTDSPPAPQAPPRAPAPSSTAEPQPETSPPTSTESNASAPANAPEAPNAVKTESRPQSSSAPPNDASPKTGQAPTRNVPAPKEQTDARENEPEAPAPDLQKMIANAASMPARTVEASPEMVSEEEEEEEPFDPALGYLLEDVDERWLSFVRQLAAVRQRLGGVFAHGRLAGIRTGEEGCRVEVAFERTLYRDDAEKHATDPAVLAALAVFGENARLYTADLSEECAPSIASAQAKAAAKAQAALEAHAKAHPVVQKALSLFGGEVRSIRS